MTKVEDIKRIRNEVEQFRLNKQGKAGYDTDVAVDRIEISLDILESIWSKIERL